LHFSAAPANLICMTFFRTSARFSYWYQPAVPADLRM